MVAVERFTELLARCGTPGEVMPPSSLWNEGNLLALVLRSIESQHPEGHPLKLLAGARWYREALLASRFLPRHRGDPLGEGWTHADGALGHFEIGAGRGDLRVAPDARQLVILEAKLGAPLSAGTTRVPDFDQAARNVACMAHLLEGYEPERIAFYVIAPEASIAAGTFGSLVTRESIADKVARRVAAYEGTLDEWHTACFLPFLDRILLGVLSWESVLEGIGDDDLRGFYSRCLTIARIEP